MFEKKNLTLVYCEILFLKIHITNPLKSIVYFILWMNKCWHSGLYISGNLSFFSSQQNTVLIPLLPFVLLSPNSITLIIINIILSGFPALKLYHDFKIYYLLLLCVCVHELFQGVCLIRRQLFWVGSLLPTWCGL